MVQCYRSTLVVSVNYLLSLRIHRPFTLERFPWIQAVSVMHPFVGRILRWSVTASGACVDSVLVQRVTPYVRLGRVRQDRGTNKLSFFIR